MWPFSRRKAAEPEAPPPVPAPPPETELQRLQREVFERIVSGTPGPAGIDDWRLQVYAGMYEARTHDALIEDVPHAAKLLGGEFLPAVKRYVAEVPSMHHSLARLGHGFAKWLREHPVTPVATVIAPAVESTTPLATVPAQEPASVPVATVPAQEPAPVAPVPTEPVSSPSHDHSHDHVHAPLSSEHAARADLADLAELEWARSEAFVADDCSPVEAEAVQQLGPERFTACWVQFVPSLRLLELSHRVTALWKALEAGEPLTEALSPTGRGSS